MLYHFAGMVSLVHPALIRNIDATQFQVGGNSKGRVEIKFCTNDNKDGLSKARLPQECPSPGNGGLVAYFIKYFLLIFSDGTSGPPVLVVANNSMENDAIDIYPE